MAQNEMQGGDAAPSSNRTWRLDLDQPSLWQTAMLLTLAFAIGAMLGLVFS